MELELLNLAKTFGPSAAIILFFVWRDFKREVSLTSRIVTLEAEQKDVLKQLVEKSTVALTQSSECIKWIGRVLEHLVRVCPRIVGGDCDKPESLR
ncbi:hypothetical protein M0R72_15480 [Candidatus Pacearchaeota archaeon]|jgi:nucleosome binding factor SPN SPT16 subunit|nr:hypothetical protein [Candidatus Pacearchaeota archaeon]